VPTPIHPPLTYACPFCEAPHALQHRRLAARPNVRLATFYCPVVECRVLGYAHMDALPAMSPAPDPADADPP
jgi:hypothetical protein